MVKFANAVNFDVGNEARAIVVGDFDGDINLELATAKSNFLDSNVSVLLGDGSGGFAPSSNLAVGRAPLSLVVEDFDEDGNLNLVKTTT